ncbi:tRNA (adenosine(37)-N6)-threonylcarbamoyltransferase complex ATPase subunit type 1 TsaE [Estrella lausannensis]|uniref:tRNA threonylcarbamoyladenosine biosynthesis protein TsaE n=1 Tax=Estrella lausannensis TaxID=483423 RepID=A0A0H5DR00_9BACT|nr:tRNA (adenosine(37)-N6)-threonylcarbamoyltransferase complex ATPase subunit type 1 TsaE [Estrella lausannensis]CRX39002.1 Conserved hypothetical protein [Estrella lausannensis]
MVEKYKTESQQETIAIATRFGASLPIGAVVLFSGDLGAGKTTFIKGLAKGACDIPASEVISPTFSILNIYKGKKCLFHFDLYRMQNAEDFIAMGFEEYLYPDGITCIEWSERIEQILPAGHYRVHIEHFSESERLISISEEV